MNNCLPFSPLLRLRDQGEDLALARGQYVVRRRRPRRGALGGELAEERLAPRPLAAFRATRPPPAVDGEHLGFLFSLR